ncbi:MAG: ABC transporter ATP-binding protein [Anaerolineaceae bacterium]|nr:ABC transporter ATP-binding protein [Anaerolineaceae bacterium]
MTRIIEVQNLYKAYGTTVAVDNISFNVDEGEIIGMVGPNGAGKTTTIECLEGIRKPDRGRIRVLGLDPLQDAMALKLQTGMQLQQSNLPDRMKVWEALDLYSSFYPEPTDWHILIEQLGLEEKHNTPFAKLSGGQKQRLFVALALLPDPKLVFLDELTTGLDPQARHAIWDLIKSVREKGKTILLTTHFMEEAEKLCDRVVILDHGKVVALDTPSALVHSLDSEERVFFSVEGQLPSDFDALFSTIGRVEKNGAQVIINGKSDDIPLVLAVVTLLAERKIKFRDFRTEQTNLEDVFLELTGRSMRE